MEDDSFVAAGPFNANLHLTAALINIVIVDDKAYCRGAKAAITALCGGANLYLAINSQLIPNNNLNY